MNSKGRVRGEELPEVSTWAQMVTRSLAVHSLHVEVRTRINTSSEDVSQQIHAATELQCSHVDLTGRSVMTNINGAETHCLLSLSP